MVNKKTVLAFLFGALIASVIFLQLQSRATPMVAETGPITSAVPVDPVAPAHTAMSSMGDGQAGSIDTLTERLRARLDKEPNDVNGWVLLGRSYHYLQRWDEARAAFAKARGLGYQGEEMGAATDAAGTGDIPADPVFEQVGRVVQQQSSQLNSAPAATGQDQ